MGNVFPPLAPGFEPSSFAVLPGVDEEFVNRVSSVSREYNSRKKDRTVMLAYASRDTAGCLRIETVAKFTLHMDLKLNMCTPYVLVDDTVPAIS